MSIYIKGVEKAERCYDCVCFDHEQDWCFPLKKEIENPFADDGVDPNCPIIDVPDHGRLVDADVLCELCYNSTERSVTPNDIMRVSTIIQADKGDAHDQH